MRQNPDCTASALLIVVHPGSACGSADFNLGRADAEMARQRLSAQLGDWRGGILVVDGALSVELSSFGSLDTAIRKALQRARQCGNPALRLDADDETPNWAAKVARAVIQLGMPEDSLVEVTGAWYWPDGRAGCVNAVCDAIRNTGIHRVVVGHSAIVDPAGNALEASSDQDNLASHGPRL